MFLSSTLEASVFMGKNFLENLHSTQNTGKDLTMKQMFDISEKLIAGQSDSSWKQSSSVNDEEVISLSHAKVYVFSDSVSCLGKVNQKPTSNAVWEDKLTWFKSSSEYRALDTIDGEPMECLSRIHHIAALPQSPRITVKIECNTRKFHWTGYLHVDVQWHLMGI